MLGVPANANSNQRFLTVEAFRRAGFSVLGLLNEPSAASIEFGHRQKTTGRILVYDLGGGTFDVSLVELDAGTHTVLASEGISTLGGDDFDLHSGGAGDRRGASELARLGRSVSSPGRMPAAERSAASQFAQDRDRSGRDPRRHGAGDGSGRRFLREVPAAAGGNAGADARGWLARAIWKRFTSPAEAASCRWSRGCFAKSSGAR